MTSIIATLMLLPALLLALSGKAAAQTDITYGGSSQVFWALVKDTADVFTEESGIGVLAMDGTSGEALPCLLAGRCNVGGMARKLTNDEMAQNRGLNQVLIAYDPMAVIVSKECKVTDVSLEVLKRIFAGQVGRWEELGDKPGPIQLVIPRAESCSHQNFATQVMGGMSFSPSATIVHTAGSVMRAIKGKRAISFGSYGMVAGRPDIAVLKVNGRYPVEQGYPLSQELYFLTVGEAAGRIKRYIDFFITGRGREFIQRVGMRPALEGGRMKAEG